jgi:hypothetical protein
MDASAYPRRCRNLIRNGVTFILGRAGEQNSNSPGGTVASPAFLGVFVGQLGDIHGYTADFAAREQF